jgi:deoxyribonuclease-4
MTKNSGNLKDVMVIHINNSKNPKNSHLDRHDIITQGHMNIADIIKFLKVIRKNNRNLIFILETPDENNIKDEFKLIK